MVLPLLLTWVIEFCCLAGFGVESRHVWPFVAVTLQTSQTKIVRVIAAAMLEWNNMIYLKFRQAIILSNAAVFTAIACQFADYVPLLFCNAQR